MSRIRSDIWCAAFVRRSNDQGDFAVVARKGDPIAGQVWIEFDHLNNRSTLLAPAPAMSLDAGDADIAFVIALDQVAQDQVQQRMQQEANFDPDFWHIVIEAREITTDLKILKNLGGK